jgi:hypothetical protein
LDTLGAFYLSRRSWSQAQGSGLMEMPQAPGRATQIMMFFLEP